MLRQVGYTPREVRHSSLGPSATPLCARAISDWLCRTSACDPATCAVQFRNFERGDDLPILDPVSNIDIDMPNVPRDLRVQVPLLDMAGTRRQQSACSKDRRASREQPRLLRWAQLRLLFLATSEDKAWKRNEQRTPRNDRMRSHRHGEGTYRSTERCKRSITLQRSTDLLNARV